MKIKEFSIIWYGPLKNRTPFRLTDFNLFWGKNEDGKTLTIDALVKLLLGRNVRDFEHIDRVEESPEGYVIIEDDKSKEIKLPEKGNLTKVVGLTPSECRNIFIIRNSDLSIAREGEFYTNVTDRLTGIRTEEISKIKEVLKGIGKITPSGIFRDVKDEKLKTRIENAKDLMGKIQNLTKEIKEERFDELEEELVKQREEIGGIIQRIEDLEDARKREKYEKGKEALDKLKETLEKSEDLDIYNADDRELWRDNERKLQEYAEEKERLLAELKEEEGDFKKVTKKLEEKEQDFQIIEQRKKVIEEMEREIKEFISSASTHDEKKKEKGEIEKRVREIEGDFQILYGRKKKIDEQIRPYVNNYEQKKETVESQEPKNRFFTSILIACVILFGLSLAGIIVKPSILFYVFSSLFLVLSFIFGMRKFQFIKNKVELAELLEKIKINLSKFELEAEDFAGLCSNLQKFEEEFSRKEQERERIRQDKSAIENEFEFANSKLKESANKITEAAAKFGWSKQNAEEYLSYIEKFREEYSKKYKELENSRIGKKSLGNGIKELKDNRIPEAEGKIQKAKDKINNIKRKSREESLQDYTQKLKLKEEQVKVSEQQKRLLENIFEKKSKALEENISFWNKEIESIEKYKEKAKDLKFDEDAVLELKEGKESFEEKFEEIKNKMVSFQNKMKEVERKANEILRLELEKEYLHCKTSVDLDAVRDKLQGFIKENESNKDNVLEVMIIFEEIETVEKEKVSELFGKDSSIPNYFNEITDGLYEEVLFNQKAGEIKVKRKDGVVLEAGKLSGGAYDQLYLSIRLALGEKLLKGKKGFFIMDDPFVKADPDRLQRQIEMLKKISELGWQIIYFSAKGEIKDVLNDYIDCGAVNYIEVQGIFS